MRRYEDRKCPCGRVHTSVQYEVVIPGSFPTVCCCSLTCMAQCIALIQSGDLYENTAKTKLGAASTARAAGVYIQ